MNTILAYATDIDTAKLAAAREAHASALADLEKTKRALTEANAALAARMNTTTQAAVLRARRLVDNLARAPDDATDYAEVRQLRLNIADLEALQVESKETILNRRGTVRQTYIALLRTCAQRAAVEYAVRAEALKETWLQIAAADAVLVGLTDVSVAYSVSWGKLSIPGSSALEAVKKIESIAGGEMYMHGETDMQRGLGISATRQLQAEGANLCGGAM